MGEKTEYVSRVNPKDVLFGRGSGPNDHEGNIEFRNTVARRKEEYMSTNNRQAKAKIALEIVQTVYAANGRFLKKVEAKELEELGLSNTDELYRVLVGDPVMEKAKQALRQNRERQDRNSATSILPVEVSNTQSESSPLPPHILEPIPVHPEEHLPLPLSDMNPGPLDENDFNTYSQRLVDHDRRTLARGIPSNGSFDIDNIIVNTPSTVNTPVSRRGSTRRIGSLSGMSGMSDLMDSIRGMSVTGDSVADSIGTIEYNSTDLANLDSTNGLSNMSLSSSVFNNNTRGRRRSQDSLINSSMRNDSFRRVEANQGALAANNLQTDQNQMWNDLHEQPLNVSMGPPRNRPMGNRVTSMIRQDLMSNNKNDSRRSFGSNTHMSNSGMSGGILSQGTMTSMMSLQSISERPLFPNSNAQPQSFDDLQDTSQPDDGSQPDEYGRILPH